MLRELCVVYVHVLRVLLVFIVVGGVVGDVGPDWLSL
jgi:hypothetical protein